MVKDNSLPETAGIFTDVKDGLPPHPNQFDNIAAEFSQMVDIFKYNFQFILPTLSTIFLLLFLSMFVLSVLLYYFMFPPHFSFLLNHV
jgi:hypothetical protein